MVKFLYKDYSDGNKQKGMVLTELEFMRRFFMHVIPRRFVRIRYYGLMANRNKKENIALCCRYYGLEEQEKEVTKTWD